MSILSLSVAPLVASLLALAAEAEHSGPNHWVVGGIVLAVLLIAVLGLLAFGAGREHS
ncbi:MAG TPA: hypothetical protein VER39_02195 [Nocardioidaceae bacterium]|nr:hypothetical protein [Nocardioidaceae bacterium]